MSLSIGSNLELAEMPWRDRWRLLRGCYLRSFLHWQTWAGICLAVVLPFIAQISVRYTFPEMTTRQAPLFGFSFAIAGWLVGSHLSSKIRGKVVRRLVRDKFPHLCKSCGYDLRATSGCCPECGSDRSHS